MRAEEFTQSRVMAKIEKTGQIVQILKHQDGDFLINTNPDTKSHMGVKWIPDTTRFDWVRKFDTLKEVNYPDELSVSDQIQQYFFKRGYELAGEGRDQMAFESPRGTIVKVLGTGDAEREKVVLDYVQFFEQNQKNPFYPRIYNSGYFNIGDERYFVYEMERVNYVANEEVTLDYIEKLMSAVDREQGEAFLEKNPVPAEMSEAEIFGLIQATEDMIQVLGGQAPLDLTAVENLGRRNNGHLVIVDPYSL
jgi:hypothetical protein